MQDPLGNENSASAKKALAKVQKMLALVQLKRHALALRDYREALDECLKTEASSAMKILGYRMASRVPTCTTHEIWATLLDASVTELASSQNAAVLVYSIPLFEQMPLPLVLSFLAASEREPMNKLRAVLQHEQSDVRCCAITTFARVTLDAADALAAHDALFSFAFESHEARIVCQQDVWTIVVDVWKVVFQALLHVDSAMPEVAGTAFAAMRMLFARTSRMAPFDMLHLSRRATQAAANDLAAAMYKEAAPRIRMLVASAQRLPTRFQVDAACWLAMLLTMMMDRSGATCPSISVPYLEIDVLTSAQAGGPGGGMDDDDDESRPTTERVRMDQLTSDVVTSWMQHLLAGRVALAPSAALCRALFIALSHPLQEFTRLQVARPLVEQLIAQCFFQKTIDARLEMGRLLVRAFEWTTSSDCVALFARVTDALHLMERDTDRRELRQQLLESICTRVIVQRDLLLLESIASMPIFRQTPAISSKQSPRVRSSDLFTALVQALVSPSDNTADPAKRQVAQLVVLKAFQPLLVAKRAPSHGRHLPSDVLSYVALLTQHYQALVRRPDVTLPESLAFFEQGVQRAWPQIPFCAVRIQLLWVAIQLHITRQLLPATRLMELLCFEVKESYAVSSDEERALKGEQASGATAAALDDGRLGGSVDCDTTSSGSSEWHDAQDVATVMTMMECLKSMAQLDPQLVPQLQELQTAIRTSLDSTSHTMATSSTRAVILDESLSLPQDAASSSSTSRSLFALHRFRPSSLFQPLSAASVAMSAEIGVDDQPTVRSREVTITGSADPIALRVSYRQPIDGHDDVVTICVTACNTTNMVLSDFELQIRSQGPVRCIDASNDTKIRLLSAGASSASTLAPFGTIKGEKRFLLQRFAAATFFIHVTFQEVESGGGEVAGQPLAMRLAASNPFVVRVDALMRTPSPQWATASFFQSAWQSAEDSVVFEIELPHDSKSTLSSAQRVLQCVDTHRLAIVQELLLDLPILSQICLLARTQWDDLVAVSLSMSSRGGTLPWSGVCTVRSTKRNMYELSKHPQDTLRALFGSQTRLRIATDVMAIEATTPHATLSSVGAGLSDRVASSQAMATSLRTASRHVSASRRASFKPGAPAAFASDPFAASDLPLADFTTAGAAKWPDSSPFDATFGADQVRPTAPTSAASGGFGSSDPWGF